MKREIEVNGGGIDYDYEGLACAVLSCKRRQDPFGGIADHDYYLTEFIPKVSERGRRALSIILTKMILDSPSDANIQELEAKVWEAATQDDAIAIIEKASEIYQG